MPSQVSLQERHTEVQTDGRTGGGSVTVEAATCKGALTAASGRRARDR